LIVALAAVPAIATGPANAATTSVRPQPHQQAGAYSVMYRPHLLNVVYRTIHGKPGADGSCGFAPPKLKLAPGSKAVEADEISVNYHKCISTWQVGTPTKLALPGGRGYSSRTTRVGHSLAANLTSSSGYERAWTTDIINITLTSDQSNISWAWDNTCVRSASGSATWTWHSSTGWSSPYNNGAWISTNCSYSDVWSQASFSDSSFCWPFGTVYSNYSGVYAEGWYDGSLYGWVNSMSYSNSCAPLYRLVELMRGDAVVR
jgi:hypothetical protein